MHVEYIVTMNSIVYRSLPFSQEMNHHILLANYLVLGRKCLVLGLIYL